MRYLVIILAAVAILITQVALFPAQAQAASQDDGIKNRIIMVDRRDRGRRDRGDWDRRYDHRRRRDWDRWDRRDRRRWNDDYYWNRRHYNYYHHRPRYRDWDDRDGFYFIGPPIPIPLPLPVPVPPLPPFLPHP